jgi:hypothetical protein
MDDQPLIPLTIKSRSQFVPRHLRGDHTVSPRWRERCFRLFRRGRPRTPMLGSTIARDPRFADRIVAETRALLATILT